MVAIASSGVMATGVVGGIGVQIAGGIMTGGMGALATSIAFTGLAIASGGILVGADESMLTFDCWKEVVHCDNKTPSKGIELEKLLSNKNVVEVYNDKNTSYLQNKWDEVFEISGVTINGLLYLHSTQV